MLGVGYGVLHDVLEPAIKDTSDDVVAVAGDSLDASSASQSTDGRLCDAFPYDMILVASSFSCG